MAVINASEAGLIVGQSSTTFATARQNGSSTVSPTSATAVAIRYLATSGRGSLTHSIYRTFLYFDTSGLTGTISDASLNIEGATNHNIDVSVFKSTAFGGDGGTALATSDFFSTIDFSTVYFVGQDWVPTTNNLDLNSTANADIQNDDAFICALVQKNNDGGNVAATSAGSTIAGIDFGTTITLTYTEAGASGPANLTSYNGIAKASITSINGITMANITTLNGIS
tara:strand:+ start:227 stop:904 length:678 start_codon:yes stop_codon:yes gene_type:complete